MRNCKQLMLLGLIFLVSACATTRDTIPTGRLLQCPEGKRPLMDCRMAFEQYQRILKFDVNVIGTYGTGFGIGAQPLITLDSITGDLLAHQQQVCVEYNNCMITQAEYLSEQKFLRRAQLKIREMANTARMSIDNIPSSPPPTLPLADYSNPTISLDEKINKVQGGLETKVDMGAIVIDPVIDNALNSLENQIQDLANKKGLQINLANVVAPLAEGTKTPGKIELEYSLSARREESSGPGISPKKYKSIKFSPGSTLKSGDQFKIGFKTDNDGYVYIVNFDSSGKAQILFPHLEVGFDNQVTAGKKYEIPDSPNTWYYLDESKGEEILYIVASPFPLPNLDSLLADLKQGKSDIRSVRQNARLKGSLEALTRGIGVSTDDQSAKVSNLKSSAITAERIEFKHN